MPERIAPENPSDSEEFFCADTPPPGLSPAEKIRWWLDHVALPIARACLAAGAAACRPLVSTSACLGPTRWVDKCGLFRRLVTLDPLVSDTSCRCIPIAHGGPPAA
jgi:hypothetical protein